MQKNPEKMIEPDCRVEAVGSAGCDIAGEPGGRMWASADASRGGMVGFTLPAHPGVQT